VSLFVFHVNSIQNIKAGRRYYHYSKLIVPGRVAGFYFAPKGFINKEADIEQMHDDGNIERVAQVLSSPEDERHEHNKNKSDEAMQVRCNAERSFVAPEAKKKK
jgi:hypothetical protein